jgi:hypothetical protein
MTHPLARLAPSTERTLVRVLAFVCVVVFGVLAVAETHNKTNVAPFGIVSFQIAGKPLMSQLILEKWRSLPDGHFWVTVSLVADYAFMIAYSTLLALIALRLGRKLATRDESNMKVATFVAWLQTLALPLDMIENSVHLVMLNGGSPETYTRVGFVCALAKFACLGAFTMFALVSGIMLLVTKEKPIAPVAAADKT